MPILVDLSQILNSSVSVASNNADDITDGMLRHLVLNTILMIKKKFGKEYGNIVLCCDSKNNWRRKDFPYYKARRKESRAESPLDWKQIHAWFDLLKKEAIEFYPYKVVEVVGCEGDDVIAQLVKYFQDNEHGFDGVMMAPQPVLIISSDHDFKQLQVYKNVSQWSPMHNAFLREADPLEFGRIHILKGDAGDGVPNIRSDNDVFVTRTRQKPVTQKLLDVWLENWPNNVPEEMKDNFNRNHKLVSLLEETPYGLAEQIVAAYKEAPTRDSIPTEYFVKMKLKNLYQNAQDF